MFYLNFVAKNINYVRLRRGWENTTSSGDETEDLYPRTSLEFARANR
jgi:hypothetical protein